MRKKVIYLDIDGVMNSQRFYTQFSMEEISALHDKYGDGFDSTSKHYINALIEEFAADVVISSVWRHSGLEVMKQMWKDRGMSGEVTGITPDVHFGKNSGTHGSVPRGFEISEYNYEVYGFKHWGYDAPFVQEAKAKCTLHSYVIIDDDQDMLYDQRSNFVKCDPLYGFTETEYNKSRRILKRAA